MRARSRSSRVALLLGLACTLGFIASGVLLPIRRPAPVVADERLGSLRGTNPNTANVDGNTGCASNGLQPGQVAYYNCQGAGSTCVYCEGQGVITGGLTRFPGLNYGTVQPSGGYAKCSDLERYTSQCIVDPNFPDNPYCDADNAVDTRTKCSGQYPSYTPQPSQVAMLLPAESRRF